VSVIWHDLECGSYVEDLELWRSLAEIHGSPVLEIGAGTGRVALDLARRGQRVTALDHDAELVSALRGRAAGLPLDAVHSDARDFELGRRFRLCIVPMQTVQLLGGSGGRRAFLHCAKRHLAERGTLAAALSARLEAYGPGDGQLAALPDVRELDGVVYASHPVAVRDAQSGFVLERRRETVAPDGQHTSVQDEVWLDRLHPTEFERELIAAGLRPTARIEVPASAEYTGSIVVVARA